MYEAAKEICKKIEVHPITIGVNNHTNTVFVTCEREEAVFLHDSMQMACWDHAVLHTTLKCVTENYTVPDDYRYRFEHRNILDSLRTVRIHGMDTSDRHDCWWKLKNLCHSIEVEFLSITVSYSGNVFIVCEEDHAVKLSTHTDKNWLFSRLLKSDVLPV